MIDVEESLERIAKALESIADSLLKLANPPMVLGSSAMLKGAELKPGSMTFYGNNANEKKEMLDP